MKRTSSLFWICVALVGLGSVQRLAAQSNAPIVLTCSSNITATTSSNCAVVFYTSTATGGCNPPPTLVCNPPSGTCFPLGTNTVTCTASNSCGQLTNCTFKVTVNQSNLPPILLTCSSNIIATTSSNCAVVFYTSTASGGCTPPPTLVCNPPSGSCFSLGTTLVTCTASNSCGQSTNCTFTVTVNQSNLPPILLTCSSNITATTSSNCVVVFYTSTASGG